MACAAFSTAIVALMAPFMAGISAIPDTGHLLGADRHMAGFPRLGGSLSEKPFTLPRAKR
jgi:hypothetical protein